MKPIPVKNISHGMINANAIKPPMNGMRFAPISIISMVTVPKIVMIPTTTIRPNIWVFDRLHSITCPVTLASTFSAILSR